MIGIWPAIGLLIGFITSALLDLWRDRRLSQREIKSRRDVSRETAKLNRIEFQRVALLDLQVEVARLARATGRVHVHGVKIENDGKAWGYAFLGEELDQELLSATASARRLRVRVADDEVRTGAQRLAEISTEICFAESRRASEMGLQEMAKLSDDLNERIGLVLRQLDQDEEDTLN